VVHIQFPAHSLLNELFRIACLLLSLQLIIKEFSLQGASLNELVVQRNDALRDTIHLSQIFILDRVILIEVVVVVKKTTDFHAGHFAERLQLFGLDVVDTIHSVSVDNPQVVLGGQIHPRSDELRALLVWILVLKHSVKEVFGDVLVLVDGTAFGWFDDPLFAIVVVVNIMTEVWRKQVKLPRAPEQLLLQVIDEAYRPPFNNLDF
jgi:hypothetical protein